MRRVRAWACAAAVLAGGALSACSQPAPTSSTSSTGASEVPAGFTRRPAAAVRRVIDGDTLVVGADERVRVLGIDTPEMRHEDPVVRELARAARGALMAHLGGSAVVLLVPTPAFDKHGRTLAYVHLDDAGVLGSDVGAALLRGGHAQVFPSAHPRREAYRELERAARAARRGLWDSDGLRALHLEVEADVDAALAGTHLGRRARVTGTVTFLKRTDEAVFARLGGGEGLLVVVFARSVGLFPDRFEESWRGRRLAVTGLVEEYRGGPEIVVEDPDQVEVLGAP